MSLTRQFFSDPSYRCCRLAKKERCEEGAAFEDGGGGASRETFTPVQRVSFFIITFVCFNVETTYVFFFSSFLICEPSLSHFFPSCFVIYLALSVFICIFVCNYVHLHLFDWFYVSLSVFFLCTSVVYFDKHLGAVHAKHWSKQSFSEFLYGKKLQKEEICSKILQKTGFLKYAPKRWLNV